MSKEKEDWEKWSFERYVGEICERLRRGYSPESIFKTHGGSINLKPIVDEEGFHLEYMAVPISVTSRENGMDPNKKYLELIVAPSKEREEAVYSLLINEIPKRREVQAYIRKQTLRRDERGIVLELEIKKFPNPQILTEFLKGCYIRRFMKAALESKRK